nr:transposase [Natrinema sp. CBA1119]
MLETVAFRHVSNDTEGRVRENENGGHRLQDVLGGLKRRIIDETVKIEYKRWPYGGTESTNTTEVRVIGVRNEYSDNYHPYVTNQPEEFTPRQAAALNGLQWTAELLFRELKPVCWLETFQTSNPASFELFVVAVLLTLVVTSDLLDLFQELFLGTVLPGER